MMKMYFFDATKDGVLFRGTIEWQVSDYECAIVSFPAGFHDHSGRTEFFRVVY